MTTETSQELFDLLRQEHNVIALNSQMQEIEQIVCRDDIKLLRQVSEHLATHGEIPEELHEAIDQRTKLFPPY